MPTNKAEQTISDDLINTVKQLQRQMLEFKTHTQQIGGDVLKVVPSTVGQATFTLAPGAAVYSTFSFQAGVNIRTLHDFFVSIYADGIDAAHAIPNGSSVLNTGATNISFEWWNDIQQSDNPHGLVSNVILLRNNDSASHTFTLGFVYYYPILPLP